MANLTADELHEKGLCVRCRKPNDRADKYRTCTNCSQQVSLIKKQRQDMRYENGLCIKCGKPNNTDLKLCYDCRLKVSESRNTDEYRAKRKIYSEHIKSKYIAEGKCIYCGKPNDNEKSKMCLACTAKSNEYGRQARRKLIEFGVCPLCKSEPLFGNEKSCPECRAAKTNRTEEYKKNNPEKVKVWNAKKNQNIRERRAERRENGLCTECAKELKGDECNYSICPRCRDKLAKKSSYYRAQKWEKPKREEWKRLGLCYQCGEEPKEGYKLCEKHYEILMNVRNSENAIAYRQRMSNVENKRIIGLMKRKEKQGA